MEVHINSNYIEGFISKYAKENSSKVVKYLAIFGIHFLDTINKQNLSISEMKSLAKSIIKSRPTEGKYINHELRVLKDELEKLSRKVASNLVTVAPQQQESTEKLLSSKKQQDDIQQYLFNRSPSIPGKSEGKTLTHKPPSAWREAEKKASERRGNHIEELGDVNFEKEAREHAKTRVSPSNRYFERQEGSVGSSKGERSITPKPNEITHSGEVKEYRNSITRHHLDDTEAKKILKEEGVIYFPKKQKEEAYNSARKETNKDPSQGKSPFFGSKKPQIEDNGHAQWGGSSEISSTLNVQSTKSPHFPHPKEEFMSKISSAQKERETSKLVTPSSCHKAEGRGTKGPVKNLHKSEISQKSKKPVGYDKKKKEVKPNRHNNLRMSQPASTPNYKNVESKIKDEINYHKELAKQYKKMKQSIEQAGGFDEDPIMGSSSRLGTTKESTRDKFAFTEKDGFGQRSSLTMQQLAHPYPEKTYHHNHRNDQENLGKNNEGHYKGSTGHGGILDIANSFLNSPLMQHISNIDSSLKESRNSNAARPPADLKSSNGFGRSLNGVSDIEEDGRLQSSNGFQQSRYSNWGNSNYQPDKSVRSTNSILKDSTNRKYGEKDLKSSCNKDGASSLASSNFSNFLNEDMKGFYQKENLDQKKPKHAGLMVRFGSSENSSNVSFNGNEAPINNDKIEKKSTFHRREYADPLGEINPKNNDGFSFEANVFKNERMTMTQLLNN